ncbi:receptor activity-modifying protein 2 isoform X1 [Struthio camelus]|uniref:receptor activity-modifying protein 2 isoform X1 n=1 Tax=Struthio camelus TaxID=8801 RepID=UPI003603C12E
MTLPRSAPPARPPGCLPSARETRDFTTQPRRDYGEIHNQTAPVRGKELLPVISIEILVPVVSRQPFAGWHRARRRAPAGSAAGSCCCCCGPGWAAPAPRRRASARTRGRARRRPPPTGRLSSWRCWEFFVELMRNVTAPQLCEWKVISRPYSLLQACLEDWADQLNYGYPNALAEQYIFQSHHHYFQNCTLQHQVFDPPEDVLLAMIIAPICLIPFLVTLVIWRSKDGKAQP